MAIIGSLGTDVVFQVGNSGILGNFISNKIDGILNNGLSNSGVIYKTIKNYQREASSRWGTHSIIGQKPVMEFIGPDLETITFDVYFSKDCGVNPTKELNNLRKLRDTGEVVPFILGNGPVLDNWVCVTDITEKAEYTDRHGNIKAVEVSITLKEYKIRLEELQQNANSRNKSGTTTDS